MNMEHSMGLIQQQLKSIAEQLQHHNRNKSILGEGITATMERGSSSRVTTLHSPVKEYPIQPEPSGYNAIHRMEFPFSNGEEARIWVRRFNRYFQMMPNPRISKVSILERFEDLDYERVVSEFNMLRHETTVNAYLEKFEELEAHMFLNEDFVMMKFIGGLKDEIKGYVATMKPTTLKLLFLPESKKL
ncbi:UNVERIFIED_CONTAM: hypothetical protein Sindi_0662700 [Sesamum indicum]